MASNFNLMPNESIILKETSVAHGGVMAVYTDELILTNLAIICINKGVFGNTKNIYRYPLNQIKMYNGKPQAIQGKLSNGVPALEVYFMNGMESFNFQTMNKRNIQRWIDEITKVICGLSDDMSNLDNSNDNDYDSDTLVGAFKEVGDQFKEVGSELMGAFGIKMPKINTKSSSNNASEKVSKKCTSCSAPLIGVRGQVIKCKYCDTNQTL